MSRLTLCAGANSFDGSRDPRTGIIAVRLLCHAEDFLTAVSGALPEEAPAGLIENQPRTFTRDESGDQGGFRVEVTLEGVTDPEKEQPELIEFTLESAHEELPIEMHPKIETVKAVYEGRPSENDENRLSFPPTITDDSGQQRKNPMAGVDSWFNPGLVWTIRYTSKKFPADLTRRLGKISQPPGDPPELSGNRNWLHARARATWRGNVWEITESWQISYPGGWVPEMYS